MDLTEPPSGWAGREWQGNTPWEGRAGVAVADPRAQMMLFYSGILASSSEEDKHVPHRAVSRALLSPKIHTELQSNRPEKGRKDGMGQLQTSTANLGNLYTPARPHQLF